MRSNVSKRKRNPRKRLSEDDIDDQVFRAVDHITTMLERGMVTREQYNSFLLDLSKWAHSKRLGG